jgi:hypothetical protein
MHISYLSVSYNKYNIPIAAAKTQGQIQLPAACDRFQAPLAEHFTNKPM